MNVVRETLCRLGGIPRQILPVGAIAALLILRASSAAQDSRGLIDSRESLYNNIYVYRQGNYVSMTFGHNRVLYTESVYNSLDERELPVTYTQYMTASLMYPKKIGSVLEIGFGGGRTAWYLHRFLPNVPITSVELDPAVVALARKHFGIKEEPNFHLVTSDGRMFLANSKTRYDIILIDAYRGPFVPFHLLTKEFYRLVKDHLTEGGVVAQNVEPSTMLFDSAVKTMQAVFSQVDFYEAGGNIVSIAYEGGPRSVDELERVARERQAALRLRYELAPMLQHRRRLLSDTIEAKAKLLTDDFAPVETLKAVERHNRKWQ